MTANDVMAKIEKEGIRVVDLRFVDMPGLWQHFTVSTKEFSEEVFEEGIGFDGSSIRGFQQIQESDMLLFPDAASAFMDPFSAEPTLCLICNVRDPVTGEDYSRDPRYIAQKAENYLKSTGIGDTAYFGPEPEFFIFDDVRFGQTYNEGYYHVDAGEGFWNAGRAENPDGAGNSRNLGYKIRYKQGYFPVPPMDSQQDLRTEMLLALEALGVEIEVHHHEVGTAGQAEIDMRFDSLVNMGDKLLKFKYAVKNVARKHGKTVTLMPKPIFQDNGSGMHVHQSIWKEGRNQFFAAGTYGDLRRDRRPLHRRHPQARAGAACADQPDNQLVPPAGARLRGADQPHLLDAEPQRGRPDPGLLEEREVEADRMPVPPIRPATGTSRSALC